MLAIFLLSSVFRSHLSVVCYICSYKCQVRSVVFWMMVNPLLPTVADTLAVLVMNANLYPKICAI